MFKDLNLTNEQAQTIENYLKDPKKTWPLAIVSKNEFARNFLLNRICENQGWKIINAQDLIVDIIESSKNNDIKHLIGQLAEKTALIINDLDFFKKRNSIQLYLEKIILKCRNPVILVAESCDGFIYGIRELLSFSTIVEL